MIFRRPIYRILFFSAWLLVLSGIVLLFISANKKNKEHLCKGINVVINGGGDKLFVQKADVLKSMEGIAKGSLIKKNFGEINLSQLEKALETNPWIRNAELYFDTKDVLNVSVSERVPFARVFATDGRSFYIDSSGYIMPLLESYSAKLPVVTGFTASKKWSSKDSATLRGIKNIIAVVNRDKFWNAQIGQIDITPGGKFELVPTIGTHIIKLGNGENIDDKLARLSIFYKQVLAKAGFAKYSALDVQFDGQVVAVKKGPQSPVDSIQLQKNIQELMRKKASEQEAEGMLPDEALPIAIAPKMTGDDESIPEQTTKKLPVSDSSVHNPIPQKTTEQKSNLVKPPVKKPAVVKPKEHAKPVQKPKGVMPGENEY